MIAKRAKMTGLSFQKGAKNVLFYKLVKKFGWSELLENVKLIIRPFLFKLVSSQ